MALALVVHGGAGAIAAERFDAARAGCRAAALAGWRVLRAGGAALDAVQAAIVVLEDDPSFNAGTGAVLTADGRAQLDAGLMDGRTLEVGAVAAVERVKNPVALARQVLRSRHVLLVGEGAERFAGAHGIALCDPADLVTPARRARWRGGDLADEDVVAAPAVPAVGDGRVGPAPGRRRSRPGPTPIRDEDRHGTVGAVAVDGEGRTAAGASTGGIAGKHPGRVGDTPLVGCGFYAEDGLAGVSCTGHGEDFTRLLLARRAAELVGAGLSAQAAASAAIRLLGERLHGEGGLILLDAAGRVGCARNTGAMAYAYIVDGMGAPAAGI
jgi:beta-aspartyl-peptidase (threonine type)